MGLVVVVVQGRDEEADGHSRGLREAAWVELELDEEMQLLYKIRAGGNNGNMG